MERIEVARVRGKWRLVDGAGRILRIDGKRADHGGFPTKIKAVVRRSQLIKRSRQQ